MKILKLLIILLACVQFSIVAQNGVVFGEASAGSSNEQFSEVITAFGNPVKAFPIGFNNTVNANAALADNTLYLIAYWIKDDNTKLTGVKYVQNVQGNFTGDNYNGIGLYSYDPVTDAITLLASTANDENVWKNSTYVQSTKAFSSPVTVSKGIYFVGLLYNSSAQTTAPAMLISAQWSGTMSKVITQKNAGLYVSIASQDALPETTDLTLASGVNSTFFVMLY